MTKQLRACAEPPVRVRKQATPAADSTDGAWIERHQADVWRRLRSLGAGPALAEDLLQETMMAALANPDRHAWSAEESRRWLFGAARNLFLHELRSSRRRQSRETARAPGDLEAEVRGEPSCARDQSLDALKHCLAQLPARSRRAIELRYGEGSGREDMGRALGVRAEGVKSLLQRIRSALRVCMARRLEKEK